MNKTYKMVFSLLGTLVSLSAANANVPNHDNPTTFVGPTARGTFTSPITDVTAFSLSGEAGIKNFRVGGTLGWRIDNNQRLKFSAEYLWQDITYSFFSGDSDQWVNQGAIGADYEYMFNNVAYQPALDISGYLSHAPSKSLGTRTGAFVNPFGVTQTYINPRRIAGSNAGGVAPGITVTPWKGGRFGLDLNYDDVRYNKNYGRNRDANGFGGTAHLNQMITENVGVGATAAVRQPFNNYAANVSWMHIPYYGSWTLSLFGDYTAGKESLPSTYDVGISADYFFEPMQSTAKANLKGDYKNEAPLPPVQSDDFLAWTADPGVFLPQVLAVTDQQVSLFPPNGTPEAVNPLCSLTIPTVIGAIAPVVSSGGTTTRAAAAAFSPSSGLTFSATASPTPIGNSVSINPTTGVITIVGVATQTFTVTVTATNACGKAVSTTFPVSITIIT